MVCFGAMVSPKKLGLNAGNSETIFGQSRNVLELICGHEWYELFGIYMHLNINVQMVHG